MWLMVTALGSTDLEKETAKGRAFWSSTGGKEVQWKYNMDHVCQLKFSYSNVQ